MPDDLYLLQDLLCQNDLCAINTWKGRHEFTCQASTGSSFLDAILLRRLHSDPQARTATTSYNSVLGAASEGASFHYPILASIPKWWRCWSQSSHASTSPASSPTGVMKLNVDKLLRDSQMGSDSWQALLHEISALTFVPSQVNEQIHRAVLRHYPSEAQRPKLVSISPKLYQRKWQVAKALRSPAGSGLTAVLLRWHLVARLRVLHRQTQRLSRRLRRDRMNRIIDDAKLAARHSNMHALFAAIRRLSPKRPRLKVRICSTSGLAMSAEDEHKTIVEYFQQLFVKEDAIGWDVPYCDTCPLNLQSIMDAFKTLNARKAVPKHYGADCSMEGFR